MNKDVIYIDVEDDITTIIGKVKSSKEKIIALVPPKRIGVLQSAVNLQLLTRTAESADKRIVLITNDHALSGLAASANIPVAKNLQSRPELAEIPALKVDNDDDIIDGRNLPIGELQKTADKPESLGSAAVNELIAENNSKKPADKKSKTKDKKGKGGKIPNFNLFRKKFVIIGGLVILLIGFLVWAIGFAPRATVVISAKSTTITTDEDVTIGTELTTDPTNKTIKAVKQETTQDISVQFSATGKKQVGERATGKVKLSTPLASLIGKTVPSGTQLTADGVSFTTNSAVTFTLQNFTGVTVNITAAAIGDDYNGISGSMSGVTSGVSADIVGETSGGTSREITVVSENDIAKATESLDGQKDSTAEDKLKSAFGSSAMIIEDSYKEERSTPSSSVAVDNEASGAVTLKATVTASMYAIDNSEMESYLKASANTELEGKTSQKIYKSGADEAKLTQYAEAESGGTIRIAANSTVGPSIDEDEVKDQVKGKNYGDIQSSLESIDGVNDVDTKFWPFWVSTVPDDTDRITIEFDLQDAS